MGLAQAAKSAPARHNTDWITDGEYLLRVSQLKDIEKKGLFIAQFDVVESDGDKAIPSGRDTSWCCDYEKFEGAFAGDVAQFLAALGGVTEAEVDEDGINAAVGTDQPFVGMLVRAKVWSKEKKTKAGEFFSVAKFYHEPDQG